MPGIIRGGSTRGFPSIFSLLRYLEKSNPGYSVLLIQSFLVYSITNCLYYLIILDIF
jgi:hypothetical protein